MSLQELHIPRKITNQLLHLAQLSPDFEICGFVSSRNCLPARCYPVHNSAEQPQQRFLFDPAQQIGAIKTMRDAGEELFAIYHSHPASPATPSITDLELAAYPEAYYLIISLNTKGVLEMRAFTIKQKIVTEIAIVMCEN
jgi:[CysO sulfur-carrier protein]-S-L-cysteine hydrolase